MPSFSFGDFGYFCASSSLPFCPALSGLAEPKCYSRNIDFSGFLLFQPAALVIDIAAIVMTLVMIYNIRRKYTAVGRKEMVIFFYMYALTIMLDFLLISNIVSSGSGAYKYFAAMYVGCVCTTFWVLLLNGLVGFQWAEDGTPWSLWSFRISGVVVFGISFLISLLTFLNVAGLGPKNSMILFIIFYLFNAGCFLVYVNLQIVLVLNTLEDRWPLGELLFGALFFITAQVVMCVLSGPICQVAIHYVDGLFFANLLTLLSVMMVYKYWDSITKEDLEFSVPSNQLLLEEKEMALKIDAQNAGSKDLDKTPLELRGSVDLATQK